MLSIFKPAPHKAPVDESHVDPLYRRLRWQIFMGIFFGYAAYYLVRKNFALAMPYLIDQGFSRGDLGFALSGISIAYGISKFIMGSVSDRSNPRVFLPAGLILAAAVMLFMGFVPWATSSRICSCCVPVWWAVMGWPRATPVFNGGHRGRGNCPGELRAPRGRILPSFPAPPGCFTLPAALYLPAFGAICWRSCLMPWRPPRLASAPLDALQPIC